MVIRLDRKGKVYFQQLYIDIPRGFMDINQNYYKKVNNMYLHEFFHKNTSLNRVNALLLNNNIQKAWFEKKFSDAFYNNKVRDQYDFKLPEPDFINYQCDNVRELIKKKIMSEFRII